MTAVYQLLQLAVMAWVGGEAQERRIRTKRRIRAPRTARATGALRCTHVSVLLLASPRWENVDHPDSGLPFGIGKQGHNERLR